VALAGVIAFLFKHYSTRIAERDAAWAAERASDHAAWAKERTTWAAERAAYDGYRDKLRAEFEERHRGLVVAQQQAIKEVFESSRLHEDTMRREFLENMDLARREFATNMETIATKASDASDRIALVLDKFYDRLLGPRRSKG